MCETSTDATNTTFVVGPRTQPAPLSSPGKRDRRSAFLQAGNSAIKQNFSLKQTTEDGTQPANSYRYTPGALRDH